MTAVSSAKARLGGTIHFKARGDAQWNRNDNFYRIPKGSYSFLPCASCLVWVPLCSQTPSPIFVSSRLLACQGMPVHKWTKRKLPDRGTKEGGLQRVSWLSLVPPVGRAGSPGLSSPTNNLLPQFPFADPRRSRACPTPAPQDKREVLRLSSIQMTECLSLSPAARACSAQRW